MGDEQSDTKFRQQKNTQNLNEKSSVLKSVFAFHNRHISSGAIKEIINSKPDLKSFETFKEIVDELEFEVVELQTSDKSNIDALDNAICFFDEGSFALISSRQAGNLSLSFKGKRNVELSIDDLLKIKKVKIFTVFPKYEPSKNIKNRIKLLNPLSNLGGINFFWIALASFTSNVLGLATSIFIMVVYDRVLPNQADQSLYALALGVGIAIVFDQLFKSARGAILENSAVHKDKKSNDQIFEQFVETKTDLTKRSIGSLTTISRDYETYKEFISSAGLLLLIDLPFILVFVLVIYYIGDLLFLVPLISVPAVIIGILVIQPFLLRTSKRVSKVNQSKQGLLVEILSGLDALRVNGAYSFIKRKFSSQADDYSKVTNSAKRFNQITTNYVSIIQQLAQIAIIVYGFHLFVDQRISMGAIIATMILSGKTLGPLAKMAQTLGRANSAYVARNNLVEFFSQQRRERFSKVGLENIHKNLAIDVQNASVKLSADSKPIFTNLSFGVNKGEKIAIIGRSGAGKTTILRALCGLLEPETGSVQINGDQASSIPRDQLFKNVGVVLQESWLFSGTLRDNLTLGYEDFSDEQVSNALNEAGAHFLGENKGEMLEFPILDRGSNLSGGQKQVICIARVLLQKPSILLLDEATSAMDSEMETTFLQSLQQNDIDQTILVVTHKPNVISICDRVMLVDSGKIAWDGTLDNYKALVAEQQAKLAENKQ
ncbi:peptidase domain-containing ABC transporter [Paracoccaceae bacterium]|nr:peptidase domain-containing ABC transporter [Paracoccaceae bacterium]